MPNSANPWAGVRGARSASSSRAVEYLRNASSLAVPILLFHGTDDDRTPIRVSAAFANVLPDLVEYEAVRNATHTRSWNVAPQVYEDTVTDFLARVTRLGSPPGRLRYALHSPCAREPLAADLHPPGWDRRVPPAR